MLKRKNNKNVVLRKVIGKGRNKTKRKKKRLSRRNKRLSKRNKRLSKRNKRLSKRNKTMRGGSISKFLESETNNSTNIVEIGKGGAGVAYLDKSQPDSVFKISDKSVTCRVWGKEASIYKQMEKFKVDTPLCKILKMKEYENHGDICYMELTRAFNPRGDDENYTIQPQFQDERYEYIYKGRGHFLGISNLKDENIFTDDNINDYIRDLAILMARLHYKVKNDGYDLELFISKEDSRTIIYIADFDLSEFYEVISPRVIERLEWSLSAFPYFPIDGDLYDIFSTNYIDEATKYGMKETAEKVLKLYTE